MTIINNLGAASVKYSYNARLIARTCTEVRILIVSVFFLLLFSPIVFSQNNVIPRVSVSADDQAQSTSSVSTPSNVIIITQEQIIESGATSLAQFLYSQGNLQLTSNSGDNSQVAVSIRGFGDNASANSLILIDGFRLTNPDMSAPDLNSISLPDIERIEIIPGSEGTLYGDQAVGGVINIITRRPQKFAMDLLAGYGSYDKQVYNAFAGDKFSNGFGYQISGQINDADNYRQHNHQTFNNFNGRLTYDYNSGSAFFKYINFSNDLLFPGSLTAEQMEQDRRQAITKRNFRKMDNAIYQAGLNQNLNNHWTFVLDAVDRLSSGNGFMFQNFNQTTDSRGIEARLIGEVYKNTLILGNYFENDDYRFNRITKDEVQTHQENIFLQDTLHLTPKLDVTLGARGAIQNNNVSTDFHSQFQNQVLVSEQGISYQWDPAWRWYIRRDGNFRFPKADEDTFLPVGITQLQAQTGTSYESGAEWKRAGRCIKFSVYQLWLRNEIAFDPTETPERPFGANRNIGTTRRNGFDLSGFYPLIPKLDLGGGYSYVDPRFIGGPFAGNTVSGVSNSLGSLAGYYQLTDKVKVYCQEQYVGSRYASDDDRNVGPRVGGYWQTNFGLHYETGYLTFILQVNNLFNKYYNLYTIIDPDTRKLFYYPAPGRSFLFSVGFDIA